MPYWLRSVTGASVPNRRPNIIYIIADDLGIGDVGVYGCKDIPTPNLDRLAAQGMRFNAAYAYPSCSPSRAALLTGQYAERFGITQALMGEDAPGFSKAVTVAEQLSRTGYATGLVGKWHLGYHEPMRPMDKGFKEFFGFLGGKIDYFEHTDTAQKDPNGGKNGRHDLWDGTTEIQASGVYSTTLFTQKATDFIERHSHEPFFLYLPFNAPHYARIGVMQAPPEKLKAFGATQNSHDRKIYAAMVSALDDGIGKILDKLSALGLDDNTLVIFSGDNGAETPGSNANLKGSKSTTAEGGIRVPALARWPGRIAPGSVCAAPVHVMDWTPTVLAAVDVVPAPQPDGINIMPLLEGNPLPDRPLVFRGQAVRLGRWKLGKGNELYDLELDPREQTDVAKAHPEIVQQLQKVLADWKAKVETKSKGK